MKAAGRLRLVAFALAGLVLLSESAGAAPKRAGDRVVFRTDLGDLVIALYPESAPRTVEQFLALVRAHVYDGTRFYRIEPGFVIQLATAADRLTPLTAEQLSVIHPIVAEFGLEHHAGVVSMAHEDGKPDSGETSFSILLGDAPHLDGKYTVFGQVERGGDVVAAIASAERDPGNRPTDRIGVTSAFVLPEAELPAFEPRPAMAPAHRAGERMPTAAPDGSSEHRWTAILVAVMMGLGLATFVSAGRASPRVTGSFGLLVALVGAFLCFALFGPVTNTEGGWGAVILFSLLIGTFRLMGRFESQVATSPKPASEAARARAPQA